MKCVICGNQGFFHFLRGGVCGKCKKAIEEYKFLMPQSMKAVNDGIQLLKQKKEPAAFFATYSVVTQHLDRLIKYEKYVRFKEQRPSDTAEFLKGELPKMINEMIHEYYDTTKIEWQQLNNLELKQKLSRQFYDNLAVYFEQMSPINKNTVERLYKTMAYKN